MCVCVLFMPLLRRCAIWNKGPIWAVLTLKAAHLAATAESGTLRHFTSFTEQSLPAFFLACTLIREVWILCRYIFFYAVAAWNPSCCCFKVYPLEPKHTHYFFSHLSLLEFAVFLFWAAVEYAAIYIFICTALKLRFHWGSTVQFSVSAHKLLENCIQTCNLSFFFWSICLLFSSVAAYCMLVTCQVTVYRSLTHVPACGYHLPAADLKSLWGIGAAQCSLMLDGSAEGSNVKGAGLNTHARSTLSSVFPLAI